MRIQLLSDLHNEFYRDGSCPDIEPCGADIIVLAGDIDLGLAGLRWAAAQGERLATPILYVAGNHEYYHHDIGLLEKMRAFAAGNQYIHFLENDEAFIGSVRFLGCTLWTDYQAAGDPVMSMLEVRQRLNDHHIIRNGPRYFLPEDALKLHQDSRAWLEEKLVQPFSGKSVVVTHHAPSLHCQHPAYPLGAIGTAFLSDLGSLVELADIWCFGHTHANVDTRVGSCRLVSNQRGYPSEGVSGFRPAFILEA